MLKFQIALAIILVGCISFTSCGRIQDQLDPVTDDTSTDMPTDMILDLIKMGAYTSWMHKMLSAPVPMADAMSPAETGAAHNPAHATTGITTARTFYINDIGVIANKEGTMYPAGTVIVKEIMDDTNMFVDKVAVMMKSDDSMYAGHNGWVYSKYARSSEDAEYMQVRGSNLEDAGNGCHGCHAKASNDSVFVSLSKDDGTDADAGMTDDSMTDHGMTDDGTTDNGMTDNGTTDDGTNNGNGNGAAQ